MAFDNNIIIVGNTTDDPKLIVTDSGMAVCNLSVAWNPPPKDGVEQDAVFVNAVCFRSLAENVAELTKGDRVILYGRIQARQYESKKFTDPDGHGAKLTAFEILCDDVGVSLRWATASPTRNEKREGSSGQAAAQVAAAGIASTEEPF